MNRWHGNTGRVERVGEAVAADRPEAAESIPARRPEEPESRRRISTGSFDSLRSLRMTQPRLETEDLLLGLILFLLYRESRDEEFLIMLAAMLLG